MANTYAINTTRGREFEVEKEMLAMGLTPWVARRLDVTYIKEKRCYKWYDVPYVPKLVFCTFPAVFWNDVLGIKHVIGKPVVLSDRDIQGEPHKRITCADGIVREFPGVHGLISFRDAVMAEYGDMERRMNDESYECKFKPGQALEIISGPFQGMPTEFLKTIKRAHDHYTKLTVEVTMMGRPTSLEIDPDMVRGA